MEPSVWITDSNMDISVYGEAIILVILVMVALGLLIYVRKIRKEKV